jgi:hypothetical protein
VETVVEPLLILASKSAKFHAIYISYKFADHSRYLNFLRC